MNKLFDFVEKYQKYIFLCCAVLLISSAFLPSFIWSTETYKNPIKISFVIFPNISGFDFSVLCSLIWGIGQILFAILSILLFTNKKISYCTLSLIYIVSFIFYCVVLSHYAQISGAYKFELSISFYISTAIVIFCLLLFIFNIYQIIKQKQRN